jgi:hypothetical protein
MAIRSSSRGSARKVTFARTAGAVRLFGRFVAGLVALAAFILVSIQFARIVNENVAMGHSLSSVRHDIQALRSRKLEEERGIRRLSQPEGAVPAIHERLRLLAPHEALIYVKTSRATAP